MLLNGSHILVIQRTIPKNVSKQFKYIIICEIL